MQQSACFCNLTYTKEVLVYARGSVECFSVLPDSRVGKNAEMLALGSARDC